MQEFYHGALTIVWYLLPMACIMLTARKCFKIPDELFRKILHFILLGAYFPFLYGFETWWISAGFAFLLILIIYPILFLAGKIPGFSAFVNERKSGEFKSSMILALGMVVTSITICWGIFDDRDLVLASVYAWGVGDAFAALIGKKYGKHKIQWKFADPHKSVEGSAAMFVTSALSVFVILMCRGGLTIFSCLIVSECAALASTLMELCTKNGLDTVTCPSVAMLVILPFVQILGG